MAVHHAVRNIRIFPRLGRSATDGEKPTLLKMVWHELAHVRVDDFYTIHAEPIRVNVWRQRCGRERPEPAGTLRHGERPDPRERIEVNFSLLCVGHHQVECDSTVRVDLGRLDRLGQRNRGYRRKSNNREENAAWLHLSDST